MVSKIFKVGDSLVISLPEEAIASLGLSEGSEVKVSVRQAERAIIVVPLSPLLSDIDTTFAEQLHDFIDQYRPALEALAQ